MAENPNPARAAKASRPETRGWDRWAPRVSRLIGWGGIVFVTAFWALTGRESTPLMGLFGSLAVGAEGLAAFNRYKEFLAALAQAHDDEE